MDEILIFNGKAGECFNPSLATAWFDCCEPIPEEKKPDGVENTENTIAAIEAITAVLEAIEAVTATIEAVTSALSVMGPLAIVGAVIALVAELLITGCPEEGFAVAQARGAEAAVYVGDYCVTEWIFGCYQSAKVFCTFESKLGRIIQEQGRPQIDRFLKREGPIGERGELILDEDGNTMVDWGTVSKPRCEGFRPIEFQALDFAKIDMSEYFDDVEEKAAEALDGAKQDFTDSIQNFYDGLDR